MTDTEIRDALTEISGAVDVPTVDRIEFQARVRSARRRRTAGRVGAAVGAMVAASVLVVVAMSRPGGGASGPEVAEAPSGAPIVGAVVDGRLVILGDDGVQSTDVAARSVLGVVDGEIVLVDHTGALVGVPTDAAGRPGEADRLFAGRADYAWLDEARGVVTIQDARTRLLSRSLAGLPSTDGTWTVVRGPGPNVAVGRDDVWVDTDGFTFTLHGDRAVDLEAGTGIEGIGLAGDTLVVKNESGVQFFDAGDGTRRIGNLGGAFGSLSPDGTTYAAVSGATEAANDMNPRAFLMDTTTGRESALTGIPADQVTRGDVAWADADTVVVVTADGQDLGDERTLWECAASSRICTSAYVDPTGTLQLYS